MARLPTLTPDGPVNRINDLLDRLLGPPPGDGGGNGRNGNGAPPGAGPPNPSLRTLHVMTGGGDRRLDTWVQDGQQKEPQETVVPEDQPAPNSYELHGRVRNDGGPGDVQLEWSVDGKTESIFLPGESKAPPSQPRVVQLDHGEAIAFETAAPVCTDPDDTVIFKTFDAETGENAYIVNGKALCARHQAQHATGLSGLHDALKAGDHNPSEHRPIT